MRPRHSALVLICCLSLGGAAAVHAAGFDCSKASTAFETMVCNDPYLGELDYVLNKVYASRLKSLPQLKKDSLTKSQRTWAKTLNECADQVTDQEFCLTDAYTTRIRALGGTGSLIWLYHKACKEDDWKCEAAGDLELRIGNPTEAIRFYSILCEADHDGDGGGNCYKKASVLEKTGQVAEAIALYAKTCQDRENNEACAAVLRLDTKKSSTDTWSGLYRNSGGTMFLQRTADGKLKVNMDTRWANGSACLYTGQGRIEGERLVVEPDSLGECTPRITRSGNVVSIRDPNDQCQTHMCGNRGLFEGDFRKE